MKRFHCARAVLAWICATVLPVGVVWAATPPPADAQATVQALTKAHQAVVGVAVNVAADARSAETLGRSRQGSGVVIGEDGLILTIGYLMMEAQNILITTHDNKTLPARAVAYDLATGFGLLQPLLPLRGIGPVALGKLDSVETGEPLMASVGAQKDEDGDVSMTQLVAKRPFSGYWEYHIESAAFTSPPIGNHSGAPLFNQKGELIGIGSLFVGDATDGKLGAGRRLPGNMFVPVDLLKPILQELRQTGETKTSRRPWLGLSSSEQNGRVQIVRVNRDSPAQRAGLESGDFVLAVDGDKVSSLEGFYKKLWTHSPDAEIKLTVLQGADIRTLVLKAVDRMATMRRPAGI